MAHLLSNLSRIDIDKLNDSDINWYPDGITDNEQEVTICFDTREERIKAMKLLGICHYRKRVI